MSEPTLVFLPWAAQGLRGEIFATCKVLEECADDAGSYLRVRGDAEAVKGLQERFGMKPDSVLK